MNVTGESKCFVSPPARSVAARGQLPFCFAKKVTQKGDPNIRPDPAVLATRGTRTNRPKVALTRNQWAHGAGIRPRVAPLLGVEYTGTPFGPMLDRFAIGFTGTRIRASGLLPAVAYP